MENDIMLPPDPARVMGGLRDTGYDFNTAVADIVDNSISAGASEISIRLDMNPLCQTRVLIADNGCGMDLDGLKNAMKYGSIERANPSSLGKFGLGLKTASTAFCRCLSVVSRGNDMQIRKVQWDLDHIAQTRQWNLRQPKATDDEVECLDAIAENMTGTLVVWEKIDRLLHEFKSAKAAQNALKKIEDQLAFHISLVYQRFLDVKDTRAANVHIILNDKTIQPWDPFCVEEVNTERLYAEDLDIEMQDSAVTPSMHIQAYLIPRRDEFSTREAGEKARVSNDMQGFYIYRENRLIHYGDWMGMFSKEPHGTLLRVELSFDHQLDDAFHVDIKKSRILLNEDLFIYLRDQVMPAPRRAADERYRKGTKKNVEEVAVDAHDASNRSIEEKAKSVEASIVTVTNEKKGEVEIQNVHGTFKHKITIHNTEKAGQCRVLTVSTLDSGILWAPTIADGKHAVEINTSHPYYQKVYYPVLSQNVMVTGMDALLWALAEAELSTFSEETREQYEDMRIQVSRCLKKLVADLPEPEMKDDEQ